MAFSIGATVRDALLAVRRTPGQTVGAVLVLCLPAVLSLGAIATTMDAGATTALQGLLAGAPATTPGAIVLRPDAAGRELLALLALLVMITLTWPVAGGLVAGAAAGQARGLRGLLSLWPAFAVAILLQLVVLGALLVALGILASLAGRIQFQLPAVVLAPGLVLLVTAALRLSLWPSFALREDLGMVRALRRSWTLSRGHATRILFAAGGIALAALGPALLLAVLLRLTLSALASHEVITLSPVAIDAWALAGLIPGALLAIVLWGLAARDLSGRIAAAA